MTALDLALETSRREASLALALGAAVWGEELDGRSHASDLVPRLEVLLAQSGVERVAGAHAFHAVFVGLGPGSYTGLRVGIATAQALARGTGALLYGLCSFEALAFAELAPGESASVVFDARAGRFYHARYERTAQGLEVLAPPAALRAAELAECCAQGGRILGHPGLAEAAGLAAGSAARIECTARPSARALLALGRARVAAGTLRAAQALEPLYLLEFGGASVARPQER
ncbi:MAG: tRNA (adenosine(37)-N6)-threonylcarbamoyltransferase complex dimerization subunit type 1 TsaB [Planctomycetes bacterium]|nr:tRNA (adenosine(37)-N6)-threonylcarbamoyltransferase complex dimerization subunit type 1 TsaB [Planctomycetota bacterium]